MYNCHSKRGNRGYWRCHNYSKKQADQRCRARCVVFNGVLKSLTGGPHNHLPHTEKIEKITKRNEVFEAAHKIHTELISTDALSVSEFYEDDDDVGDVLLGK